MSLVYRLGCCLVVLTRCFAEIQVRGCETNLTNLNGTIKSFYPTPEQTDSQAYTCEWNIELRNSSESRHVELQFTKFHFMAAMPECSGGDYVELFLGCSNPKSIGKFCGQMTLPVIYSPDHCLQIVLHGFVAFESSPRSEFKAVYNQRLLSRAISQNYFGCGKEQHSNARHGNIFSPHWPLPYPRYVDCVWHLTTRPGLHLKLVFFDFDVRSTDACAEADFVEVKTGAAFNRGESVMNNKEFGRKAPFSLTIDRDSIFIQFKSDVVTGNRGFMAGFVAYSVDNPGANSHVLILLGVIFLAPLALVGKSLLQRLIERSKLHKKSISHRFRRRSQTAEVSPIIVSQWGESVEFEEQLSAIAQCETPSSEDKMERSPSKVSVKTVTFETTKTKGRRCAATSSIIGENEPHITFL